MTPKNNTTFTDWLIPQFVRFQWGYGYISLALAIMSFGMSIVTMLTVKGIYISLWMLCGIAIAGAIVCFLLGYFCEKYDIMNRIATHINTTANPEIKKMYEDVQWIKQRMELELDDHK